MPRKPGDPGAEPPSARAGAAAGRPIPFRQPETPMRTDRELHETLDLLSQVVADISDRVDGQTAALGRLADAQARTDPERVAVATSKAVRETFLPDMTRPRGRRRGPHRPQGGPAQAHPRPDGRGRPGSAAGAGTSPLPGRSPPPSRSSRSSPSSCPARWSRPAPTCWAMGGHWMAEGTRRQACVFWLDE